ncbi:MAG: L,D-transpeptidase [Acidimicrobiales bacterium]
MLSFGLLFGACGGGGDDSSDDAADEAESPGRRDVDDGDSNTLPEGSTWAATAKSELAEVSIYDTADASEAASTLPNPDPNGTPLVFLVDGADASGERIPVFLPIPPNGTKGWVNASDVDLLVNPYRITVEVAAHRLTVTDGGEVTVDTEVAVGQDGRETPTGQYYVKELLQPPDPNGVYGPYAYGISGFTNNPEVAEEFGGGGVIGIHGTNDPDALGTDVSSGCIRMANDVITEMVDYLPLGTPVEIVA